MSTVAGVDLVSLVDHAMLGPIAADFEFSSTPMDWSDVHGEWLRQPLSEDPGTEGVVASVLGTLREMVPDALPVLVAPFPANEGAPVLLTGDSDDATAEQLETYLDLLEESSVHGTILLKDARRFSRRQISAAVEADHSFGIHPYAASGSVREYRQRFTALFRAVETLTGELPVAVRNHRFQWVGRNTHVDLEAELKIPFDLNNVAANGRAWLGSASGLASPYVVPRGFRAAAVGPRQLPTALEDDIFLYQSEYSYSPFRDGDLLSLDAIIRFLEQWQITGHKATVVNLHPEHVRPHNRWLLCGVLEWIDHYSVWAPSLKELQNWLIARENARITVERRDSALIAHITGPVNLEWDSHFPVVGTREKGRSWESRGSDCAYEIQLENTRVAR
jgi:hypothetical protein